MSYDYYIFKSCSLSSLISSNTPSILDIGSLKYLFPNTDYADVDLAEGPNVVASGDKYNTDKRYDITVSCECFEHNPQYL